MEDMFVYALKRHFDGIGGNIEFNMSSTIYYTQKEKKGLKAKL